MPCFAPSASARIALGCLALSIVTPSLAFAAPFRVGIIIDTPRSDLARVAERAIDEALATAGSTITIELPGNKRRISDGTLAGVKRDLDVLLEDDDVDLVL